jgi:hypothetical protein
MTVEEGEEMSTRRKQCELRVVCESECARLQCGVERSGDVLWFCGSVVLWFWVVREVGEVCVQVVKVLRKQCTTSKYGVLRRADG